jgi:hypothetical protein
VITLSALLAGIALAEWLNARDAGAQLGLVDILKNIDVFRDVFFTGFAAMFLIVSMAMLHLVRPISKRGKALQFSPSFLTALMWGWMKLSVWVDGNSITIVGPSTFVERLTRTVKATWSPADQLPRGT